MKAREEQIPSPAVARIKCHFWRVMALTDDVLTSIPHNDVLRLVEALRKMSGNSEVDAASCFDDTALRGAMPDIKTDSANYPLPQPTAPTNAPRKCPIERSGAVARRWLQMN